jgi:hypothetical protein
VHQVDARHLDLHIFTHMAAISAYGEATSDDRRQLSAAV